MMIVNGVVLCVYVCCALGDPSSRVIVLLTVTSLSQKGTFEQLLNPYTGIREYLGTDFYFLVFFFFITFFNFQRKRKEKKKKMIISKRRRKKKGLKRWNMDNLMEYDVKDNTLDHSLISFSWKPKKGRASLLLNQLPLVSLGVSTTTVCTREFTYISSTSTFHLSLSLSLCISLPLLYNGDECGGHAPSSSTILSRSYPFQFRDPER